MEWKTRFFLSSILASVLVTSSAAFGTVQSRGRAHPQVSAREAEFHDDESSEGQGFVPRISPITASQKSAGNLNQNMEEDQVPSEGIIHEITAEGRSIVGNFLRSWKTRVESAVRKTFSSASDDEDFVPDNQRRVIPPVGYPNQYSSQQRTRSHQQHSQRTHVSSRPTQVVAAPVKFRHQGPVKGVNGPNNNQQWPHSSQINTGSTYPQQQKRADNKSRQSSSISKSKPKPVVQYTPDYYSSGPSRWENRNDPPKYDSPTQSAGDPEFMDEYDDDEDYPDLVYATPKPIKSQQMNLKLGGFADGGAADHVFDVGASMSFGGNSNSKSEFKKGNIADVPVRARGSNKLLPPPRQPEPAAPKYEPKQSKSQKHFPSSNKSPIIPSKVESPQDTRSKSYLPAPVISSRHSQVSVETPKPIEDRRTSLKQTPRPKKLQPQQRGQQSRIKNPEIKAAFSDFKNTKRVWTPSQVMYSRNFTQQQRQTPPKPEPEEDYPSILPPIIKQKEPENPESFFSSEADEEDYPIEQASPNTKRFYDDARPNHQQRQDYEYSHGGDEEESEESPVRKFLRIVKASLATDGFSYPERDLMTVSKIPFGAVTDMMHIIAALKTSLDPNMDAFLRGTFTEATEKLASYLKHIVPFDLPSSYFLHAKFLMDRLSDINAFLSHTYPNSWVKAKNVINGLQRQTTTTSTTPSTASSAGSTDDPNDSSAEDDLLSNTDPTLLLLDDEESENEVPVSRRRLKRNAASSDVIQKKRVSSSPSEKKRIRQPSGSAKPSHNTTSSHIFSPQNVTGNSSLIDDRLKRSSKDQIPNLSQVSPTYYGFYREYLKQESPSKRRRDAETCRDHGYDYYYQAMSENAGDSSSNKFVSDPSFSSPDRVQVLGSSAFGLNSSPKPKKSTKRKQNSTKKNKSNRKNTHSRNEALYVDDYIDYTELSLLPNAAAQPASASHQQLMDDHPRGKPVEILAKPVRPGSEDYVYYYYYDDDEDAPADPLPKKQKNTFRAQLNQAPQTDDEYIEEPEEYERVVPIRNWAGRKPADNDAKPNAQDAEYDDYYDEGEDPQNGSNNNDDNQEYEEDDTEQQSKRFGNIKRFFSRNKSKDSESESNEVKKKSKKMVDSRNDSSWFNKLKMPRLSRPDFGAMMKKFDPRSLFSSIKRQDPFVTFGGLSFGAFLAALTYAVVADMDPNVFTDSKIGQNFDIGKVYDRMSELIARDPGLRFKRSYNVMDVGPVDDGDRTELRCAMDSLWTAYEDDPDAKQCLRLSLCQSIVNAPAAVNDKSYSMRVLLLTTFSWMLGDQESFQFANDVEDQVRRKTGFRCSELAPLCRAAKKVYKNRLEIKK